MSIEKTSFDFKNVSSFDGLNVCMKLLVYILGTMAAIDPVGSRSSTFLEVLKKNVSNDEHLSDASKSIANAIICAAEMSAKEVNAEEIPSKSSYMN
jgi:hypothetical protein